MFCSCKRQFKGCHHLAVSLCKYQKGFTNSGPYVPYPPQMQAQLCECGFFLVVALQMQVSLHECRGLACCSLRKYRGLACCSGTNKFKSLLGCSEPIQCLFFANQLCNHIDLEVINPMMWSEFTMYLVTIKCGTFFSTNFN